MANISGIWLGTYWQQEDPVRFELSVVQGGNSISGNILDDSYLGEASITGEVTGRRISFTKKYLGSPRPAVFYLGLIAEDEILCRDNGTSMRSPVCGKPTAKKIT